MGSIEFVRKGHQTKHHKQDLDTDPVTVRIHGTGCTTGTDISIHDTKF
jgi:hypothetical protein